jgi:hypothetical protein
MNRTGAEQKVEMVVLGQQGVLKQFPEQVLSSSLELYNDAPSRYDQQEG